MTKYAKKFDEIPIIIHESEKPSICCEETYGGKIYSNFQTSNTKYGKQNITQDDIDAVVETLKSPYLTCGPKVKEFEQANR